jgi:hypothetical protein
MAQDRDPDWGGRERRRSTRVDAKVALQLSEPGRRRAAEPMATESINLGAEGVYCMVPTFVAPLTKLQITMVLPLKGNRGQVRNEVVKAGSVVVRCQPAGGGYRIACFFSDLAPAARDVLEEYLAQHGDAAEAD